MLAQDSEPWPEQWPSSQRPSFCPISVRVGGAAASLLSCPVTFGFSLLQRLERCVGIVTSLTNGLSEREANDALNAHVSVTWRAEGTRRGAGIAGVLYPHKERRGTEPVGGSLSCYSPKTNPPPGFIPGSRPAAAFCPSPCTPEAVGTRVLLVLVFLTGFLLGAAFSWPPSSQSAGKGQVQPFYCGMEHLFLTPRSLQILASELQTLPYKESWRVTRSRALSSAGYIFPLSRTPCCSQRCCLPLTGKARPSRVPGH